MHKKNGDKRDNDIPEKDLDYLFILKALDEIPFGVGKKLLIGFLKGDANNESIRRNRLDKKDSFGSMAYDDDELRLMIDRLITNNLVMTTSVNNNRFWKVLELTQKGRNEIDKPTQYRKSICLNYTEKPTEISQKDKELFAAFGSFLEKYNDAQKKAIISPEKTILCIAGAGSGKTTVLTKRIEFLIRYRSTLPGKILAITFTRKARQEMISRLQNAGIHDVNVETFNSFCEKTLRKHNDKVYGRKVRVLTYRDKKVIMSEALRKIGLTIQGAINIYFTYAQQRSKSPEQLANIFMNDCFMIRDHCRFRNVPVSKEQFDFVPEHEKTVRLVTSVCSFIDSFMKKHGLRDFADQLIDTLMLFRMDKTTIPCFDHVLVDEYQDVNSSQITLIDMLAPGNIFCVGDPRQAIYGWRGSDIQYILEFEEKYRNAQVITLTRNYRSSKHIVDLVNLSVKNMGLADLKSDIDDVKDIRLLKFPSEDSEFEFIIQRLLNTDIPRKDIFVLARTNRQLNDLSNILKLRNIPHVVRSDELKKTVIAGKDDVTLATVHAIKGLEAQMVFVIGANSINYPCRGSEHPVIDMLKTDEYDKEEEERRLFYVAMSRARKSLYITYTGKRPTIFLTKDMITLLEGKRKEQHLSCAQNLMSAPATAGKTAENRSGKLFQRLKEWRLGLARQLGVPAFRILPDSALIDITQKMPLTKEDLEEVNGLGPVKIMRYGDDILAIVN